MGNAETARAWRNAMTILLCPRLALSLNSLGLPQRENGIFSICVRVHFPGLATTFIAISHELSNSRFFLLSSIDIDELVRLIRYASRLNDDQNRAIEWMENPFVEEFAASKGNSRSLQTKRSPQWGAFCHNHFSGFCSQGIRRGWIVGNHEIWANFNSLWNAETSAFFLSWCLRETGRGPLFRKVSHVRFLLFSRGGKIPSEKTIRELIFVKKKIGFMVDSRKGPFRDPSYFPLKQRIFPEVDFSASRNWHENEGSSLVISCSSVSRYFLPFSHT